MIKCMMIGIDESIGKNGKEVDYMKRTKEQYIDLLEKIFFKYNMSGSLLEKAYTDGIKSNDLTCCYVDGRIKNSKKLRKELREVIEEFLKDYPEVIKPLYS